MACGSPLSTAKRANTTPPQVGDSGLQGPAGGQSPVDTLRAPQSGFAYGGVLFTHLHSHTEYSLLDGLSRIAPMLQRTKELGMDSLAITDHGTMHGAIDFYSEARHLGINPIMGLETYVAAAGRHHKSGPDKSPYHLTLLAKDNAGYHNLIQLASKAHLEGFYYKPRVDRELLEAHHTGLIVLSGCLNGEMARLITGGMVEEARATAQWFQQVFGEDFYLELQRHESVPTLDPVNEVLLDFGRELGIPLVATNDFHYVDQADAPLQDVLICIHTNTTVNDDKRLKMDGDSYYLKSPQEMAALFHDIPEAIANTQRIAGMCDVEISFDRVHLPGYATPNGEDADAYLSHLCWEGLTRRLPEAPVQYRERLDYELDVIRQTQFANYFLVVWDIIAFAREHDILFGVRGSAAGSLALYCLGVTDVDPVEYTLIFERFLNVERKEMPDIDMDFQDDRRDEVIQHVLRKYGRDHVAQIVTFGTLGPKAAIRDVGRALAMPYADVDRVARLVPFRARTLSEAMEQNPELAGLRAADSALRHLIETAQQLEGLARHTSTHAAGVVISQEPLTEHVPLQRPVRGDENAIAMTQFSMEPIAHLGLLKMDFLGLINLTILKDTIKLVEETRGEHLDLQRIPLDDKTTFDLLASGETADVFQLEGSGMRRNIKQLRPSSLREVAAMIALYRPGPMEHIETYIKAKHGQAQIQYPHPSLKELLEETYGIIVYQDQVLQIIQRFAGYSMGEADVVRKAMGKKIAAIMREERVRFLNGAQERGYALQDAEAVFQLIEPFAGYAFNKAHAVSYALIAYWTAYFKANYPEAYMTAVLNSRMENMEKVASATNEARRLRIPVLAPDINHSQARFAMQPQEDARTGIRFGLTAVKNVGESAVQPLVEARVAGGPFTSLEDLCRRVDLRSVNRRTMESLIKVGALDCLGVERSALLAGLDRILRLAQQEARMRQSGQTTMLDLFGDSVEAPPTAIELPPAVSASPREKLAWEQELLGVGFSDNPFSAIVASIDPSEAIISIQDIDPEDVGKRTVVVGAVASVRTVTTKEGKPFAAAMLALMDGSLELIAWPNVYQQCQELLVEGNLLRAVGKLRTRDDQVSLAVEELSEYRVPTVADDADGGAEAFEEAVLPAAPLAPAQHMNGSKNSAGPPAAPEPAAMVRPPPAEQRQLRLTLRETADPVGDGERLHEVLRVLLEFRGKDKVLLNVLSGGKAVQMEAPYTADYGPTLHQRLEALLGADAVTVTALS